MLILITGADGFIGENLQLHLAERKDVLVPVKDATALAHAIECLHLDPGWARQLGLVVKVRAIAEFVQPIVIAKTLGVDGELVG